MGPIGRHESSVASRRSAGLHTVRFRQKHAFRILGGPDNAKDRSGRWVACQAKNVAGRDQT